jgi:hypothetical protein
MGGLTKTEAMAMLESVSNLEELKNLVRDVSEATWRTSIK